MVKKAVVAGASGLIGGELLKILLNEPFYEEVLVLVRKELPMQHKKLVQLVMDFEQLDQYASFINGHAIFSCLGSTRKKTPDKDIYYRIDHDYPLALAHIAVNNQVKHFHLVSAIGANKNSSNFYLKLKGETEYDMQLIGIQSLHIYQPAMLTGNRKEYRWAEKVFGSIMKVLDPLLVGPLKQYRTIPAQTVAQAIYKQSLKTEAGVFVHKSHHIINLT